MKRLVFSGLAIAATLLLGSATASEPASETTPITQLVFRDKTVLISAGPTGIQYSLLLTDGTVLANSLTDDQLAAQYPDLHDQVQTLIAGPNPGDDVMIWGGL